MSNIKKLLGQKISRVRKARGFTQMQLAERIGISTNALSLIETGVGFFTAETMEKLINTLDILPEELFSFDITRTDEELYNQVLRKLEMLKNNREVLDLLNTILNKLI